MDKTSYRTRSPSRRMRLAPSPPPRRTRTPMITAIGVGALLLLAILALGRDSTTLSSSGMRSLFGIRASTTGKQILEDLSTRYRELNSYEDRTRMRMQVPVGQRWHEEVVDILVRYVRPGKLRLHVDLSTIQLLVTSDGKRLHSRIFADANKQLNRQFVEQQAPAALSLRDVLMATEIVSVEKPDQIQSVLMNLPCPLPISQLTLLFDPGFMQQLLASSTSIDRLTDRPLGGRPCARVQLTSPTGEFVFWIDFEEGLLRRIEYPNPTSPQNEKQTGGSVAAETSVATPLRLSVDYDDVKINGVFPPSGFRQEPPLGSAMVRHFVVPPENDAVSILGRRVSHYWFTDLDNNQIAADQLNATVNVLVWFNNRGPSRAVLEQLTQVFNAQPESVNFLGVCTEPTTAMSHEDIRQLQLDWKVPFPIVRDLQAFGRDIFAIKQAPTLVAIDRHGTVQLFEVGGNSELSEQLPIVFEKLKAGEPLAKNYLDFLDRQAASYRQMLAAASIHPPTSGSTGLLDYPRKEGGSDPRAANDGHSEDGGMSTEVSTPPAHALERPLRDSETAPLSQPMQSTAIDEETLQREWTTKLGVDAISHLHLVASATGDFLIVGDEQSVVYELALHGQRRETYPLIGAQGQDEMRAFVISPTRSLFATFGTAGPLYVFDKKWISRFAYPESGLATVRVTDTVMDDLDADGEPEVYVALGDRELHRIDVRGQRVWTLDAFHRISSLAVSHDRSGKRFLLVAHDDRRVTPLSADGEQFESIILDFNAIQLLASPRRSEDGAFCALSRQQSGKLNAVGLNANFEEIWRKELPDLQANAHRNRVQWVPWISGANRGAWLIQTAADKLLIVSEDGAKAKSLSMRFPLKVATGTVNGGANLLIGAVDNTVMAWTIKLGN